MDARTLAQIAARAADEHKATEVVVLDLRGMSDVADYFVVASAISGPHLRALVEHVEKALDLAGARRPRREGLQGSRWILLDYGEVVVHFFHHADREFYRIEALWDRAPRVEVPGGGTSPR